MSLKVLIQVLQHALDFTQLKHHLHVEYRGNKTEVGDCDRYKPQGFVSGVNTGAGAALDGVLGAKLKHMRDDIAAIEASNNTLERQSSNNKRLLETLKVWGRGGARGGGQDWVAGRGWRRGWLVKRDAVVRVG